VRSSSAIKAVSFATATLVAFEDNGGDRARLVVTGDSFPSLAIFGMLDGQTADNERFLERLYLGQTSLRLPT